MTQKPQKVTYYEPTLKQQKYATRGGYIGGIGSAAGLIGRGLIKKTPITPLTVLPTALGAGIGFVGGRMVGVKLAGKGRGKKRTITLN